MTTDEARHLREARNALFRKNFLACSKSSIVLLATTAYIRTSLVVSLDGTPWVIAEHR